MGEFRRAGPAGSRESGTSAQSELFWGPINPELGICYVARGIVCWQPEARMTASAVFGLGPSLDVIETR